MKHPQIDKVSFTGSTAAGHAHRRALRRAAQALHARARRQVGGDRARRRQARRRRCSTSSCSRGLMNNGQVCGAQSRILVSRSRYDEVVDALGAAVGALQVGDPLDEATQIGPLVAERQRTRVEGYLEAGKSAGARVVTGGGRPATLDTRLVRRAHGVRRRRQLDEDRAGRDLRPGALGDPVRQRGPGGEDRQRLRLRALRLGLDCRRRARRADRGTGAHRCGRDQLRR